MKAIMLRLPFYEVKNGMLSESFWNLDYSIILPEKNLSIKTDTWSVSLPQKYIVLIQNLGRFFDLEFFKDEEKVTEYELLFVHDKTKKIFDSLKFRNLKVFTGLMDKHELTDELMDNTPLPYDKDSINDSLMLLKLKENVEAYAGVVPSDMINELDACMDSLNLIQPLTEFKHDPLFITLKHVMPSINGLRDDVSIVRKSFKIKKWPEKVNFGFLNYGKGFLYNIRKLGRVSNSLRDLYTRD